MTLIPGRFDGTVVSNAYDSDGRLSSVAYPDGNLSISNTPSGLLQAMGDAVGTIHCEYDGFKRLTWASGVVSNSRVDYTYLAAGQVATASSLMGQVSFSYDAAERMTEIACQNSEGVTSLVYQFSYNPTNGLLACVTNVGGMQMGCGYDVMDQLTTLTWQNATGGVIRSFGYQYDVGGMITQNVTLAAGQSVTNIYGYDALDRLTRETSVGSVTSVVNYYYDLAGNRTQMVVNGSTSIYTMGTGNQMVSWRTNGSQQFDAAGNVTNYQDDSGRQLSLAWDSRYRLTSISTNGDLAESFSYDALGRQISISDGASTNYLIYDGVHAIAEVNVSGNLLKSYTYGLGIDNILTMTVYGSITSTYYYVKDHLGSVAAVADSGGQIVESYQFDAWGKVLGVFDGSGNSISNQQSQIGNRFLWQGREYSWKTGLYYFRARWYEPVTGRWLSNDPIGISAGLTQYQAFLSNPVKYRDPNGEVIIPAVIIAIGTGVAIIGGVLLLDWWFDKVEEMKNEGIVTPEAGGTMIEIAVELPGRLADPGGLPIVSGTLKPITDEVIERYSPDHSSSDYNKGPCSLKDNEKNDEELPLLETLP